jgi:hypothetical protein
LAGWTGVGFGKKKELTCKNFKIEIKMKVYNLNT